MTVTDQRRCLTLTGLTLIETSASYLHIRHGQNTIPLSGNEYGRVHHRCFRKALAVHRSLVSFYILKSKKCFFLSVWLTIGSLWDVFIEERSLVRQSGTVLRILGSFDRSSLSLDGKETKEKGGRLLFCWFLRERTRRSRSGSCRV
jgi:hypothetical protein